MAGPVNGARLALPVYGERFGLEPTDEPGAIRVVRLAKNEPAGTLEVDWAADAPFVRALCIEPGQRGYGAGSEAIQLFNRGCDEAQIPLVRTWAPPDRGLAVYFWIRMGFRPIGGEGPDGGIWFERRPAA